MRCIIFVENTAIDDTHIHITGQDVNHIMNVLRLKEGEPLVISNGEGLEYQCEIEALTNEVIQCKIQSVDNSMSELPIQVTLYQGAPKQDKMEQVTQKCVELGAYEIVSVQMRRSIVKYDEQKAVKKFVVGMRLRNLRLNKASEALFHRLEAYLTGAKC